jgi:hypothetical protein
VPYRRGGKVLHIALLFEDQTYVTEMYNNEITERRGENMYNNEITERKRENMFAQRTWKSM